MKHIQAFNELKSGTYEKARDKAKQYGNHKLMSDFNDYHTVVREEEFNNYHKKINSNIYKFDIYKYSVEDGEAEITDIIKYEDVYIEDIVTGYQEYTVRLYDGEDFLSIGFNVGSNSVEKTMSLKPLNWRLANKKDALLFIEKLKDAHTYYIDFEQKANQEVYALDLDVRYFYIRDINKDYEKQEMEKNTKKYKI